MYKLLPIVAFAAFQCSLLAQTAPPLEWQHSFGGTVEDQAKDIRQTTDGGYIVAGSTSSSNGDVIYNHGGADYWVMKLDAKNY